MNVYSSELLELSDKYIELINIAHLKVTRRFYKLPDRTDNFIVNALDNSIEMKLHINAKFMIVNLYVILIISCLIIIIMLCLRTSDI